MKKSVQYIIFAILTVTLSITAFADVKVKSRMTMSGQSTENTTYIKGKRSRTEQAVSNRLVFVRRHGTRRARAGAPTGHPHQESRHVLHRRFRDRRSHGQQGEVH